VRGWDGAVLELVGDLTHRASAVDVEREDLAHDQRLGLVDLKVSEGAVAVGENPTVAVGHTPEDHRAGAGSVQLAAAGAFGDLRALVLADHALHLDQQRGLRIGAHRGPLEEHHLDGELLELLEDQHLVGVGAGQAIRAQAQHRVQRAGLRGVAQPVKRGAVKPRSGVAVIDELADHRVPVASGGTT
jgi:hypothetical protein